ncbi:MAG: hypothetical protein ACKVIN_10615 [Longimicrobiales bacterium]
MKRELITILIGASFFASDVEAQRNRDRDNQTGRDDRDGRVEQLEPVHARGRIAPRTIVYRSGRPEHVRSRVVYSSNRRRRSYAPLHVWVRADWGRVRMQPFAVRANRTVLNQRDLRNVLGRRTVDRVRDSGRRAGLRGSLRGHWVEQRGQGRVLVVTMDRIDVAEFVDFDRDGFVDDVFLVQARGNRRVGYGW